MIDHNNWYEYFFDGMALDLWERAITSDQTQKEIDFIHKIISLPAGAKILDAPCGFGRHTLLLASQGFPMTGIDISVEYIRKLEREAQQQGLSIDTLNLNILEFTPEPDFDLVLCLGNSFNYFNHKKMEQFIGILCAALKPGGHLLVNTGSIAETVFLHFQPERKMQLGDMSFLMANEYNYLLGALRTEMEFIIKGRSERKTAFHFTYTLAEINRLMKREGFEITGVYGDIDSKAFELGDQQAYILARKFKDGK